MKKEVDAGEYMGFLESFIRLMLWFARDWSARHPDESFASVVMKRTDIWRQTDFNPGPPSAPASQSDSSCGAWFDLVGKLAAAYERTLGDDGSNRFEEQGFGLLRNHVVARVKSDLEDFKTTQRDIAAYQCGSLRYNTQPEAKNPRRIGFHISNACYPGSLFGDPLYMPACFLAMTIQCELKFGVTEITTTTWLNSHPKWLALFPEEWQSNLGEPDYDVRGHYGFWGQFVTAGKTFNHKLGEQFRREGKIPYPVRFSWCSIKSMRAWAIEIITNHAHNACPA